MKFEVDAKEWVRLFISVYQTKDVTPYMHAFAMHVPEFLWLHHGNISIFSQQGLENSMMYQRNIFSDHQTTRMKKL